MFEKIKKFYELGIYKEIHVRRFVQKGAITETQFKEITGVDY